MARPAYSTRLLAELGLNGTVTITPAAGFRYVIRDIDVYANNSGLSPIHFRALGELGQTIWLFQVDPDTNAIGQWRGRQVIESGLSAQFATDSPFDVTVSGYVLTD